MKGKTVGGKKDKIFKMTIPSSLEYIESVEKLAEKAADAMKFSEEEKDSLAIAVTEAVNNAIIHGNKLNKNKKVFISFQLENKRLLVSIIDQGKGFNPQNLSDPLAPENLLKESGRGIFILSTLMDDVRFEFRGNGTEVIMTKEKK
jgi:serine/threonine-protein kinase RsbW